MEKETGSIIIIIKYFTAHSQSQDLTERLNENNQSSLSLTPLPPRRARARAQTGGSLPSPAPCSSNLSSCTHFLPYVFPTPPHSSLALGIGSVSLQFSAFCFIFLFHFCSFPYKWWIALFHHNHLSIQVLYIIYLPLCTHTDGWSGGVSGSGGGTCMACMQPFPSSSFILIISYYLSLPLYFNERRIKFVCCVLVPVVRICSVSCFAGAMAT